MVEEEGGRGTKAADAAAASKLTAGSGRLLSRRHHKATRGDGYGAIGECSWRRDGLGNRPTAP